MITIPENFLLRRQLEGVRGKKVLVRIDANISPEEGRRFGAFRVWALRETLRALLPAAQIILCTHIGDPREKNTQDSTRRLIPFFKKILPWGQRIAFHNWQPGEKIEEKTKFVLLENIRFFEGEKKNDEVFAQSLAAVADLYVNEAFSVSHRVHASIVALPRLLPSFFGYRFEQEVLQLSRIFSHPQQSALVLSGAKIETKLPLLKNFLQKVDIIMLGGGIAHTYMKSNDMEIGNSLHEDRYLAEMQVLPSDKIMIPQDAVCEHHIKDIVDIDGNDNMLDIGPKTVEAYSNICKQKKLIIWNGPLGKIEDPRFEKGTLGFAKNLMYMKNTRIVGGGDTLALLCKNRLEQSFSFVSTGGGAMLDFLARETLPGIEAIVRKN